MQIKNYKILKWLLMGAIFLLAVSQASYAGDPIFDRQVWNNRVLVITGAKDDPRYAEQVDILAAVTPDLEERRIVVIHFKDGILKQIPDLSPFEFRFKRYKKTSQQRYLQNRLGTDDDIFSVVLVGLDGERKEVWDEVIAPEVLFAAIDAMPMRQREINAQ